MSMKAGGAFVVAGCWVAGIGREVKVRRSKWQLR